jgi:hypothetical protein
MLHIQFHTCLPTYITLHSIALHYITNLWWYYITNIHTFIHACMHAWIHSFIQSIIHLFIYSFIHSFIHSHMHTYIHTYIYIYQWYHPWNWWMASFISFDFPSLDEANPWDGRHQGFPPRRGSACVPAGCSEPGYIGGSVNGGTRYPRMDGL